MKKGKRVAYGVLAGVTALSSLPVAELAQIMHVRAESLGNPVGTGSTAVEGNVVKHYGEITMSVDNSFYVSTEEEFLAYRDLHTIDSNAPFNGVNYNQNGLVSISNFNGVLIIFKSDPLTGELLSERFEVQNIKPLVDVSKVVSPEFKGIGTDEYLTNETGKLPVRVKVSGQDGVVVKDIAIKLWLNGVLVEKTAPMGETTFELDLPDVPNNLYNLEYEVTDASGTVVTSNKGAGDTFTVFKESANKPVISVSADTLTYSIAEKKQNIGKVGFSYIKGESFSGNFVEQNGVLIPKGGTLIESRDFTAKSSTNGVLDLSSITEGGKYLLFASNGSLVDSEGSVSQVSYFKDVKAPVIDATVVGQGVEVNNKYWFREVPKVNYSISDDIEVAERFVVFVEEGTTNENEIGTLGSNEGTFEIENTSKRGIYKIKAVDTSGKVSYKDLGSFTPYEVDSIKPVIEEISIKDIENGFYKIGSEVEIPVSVSDSGSGVKSVKVLNGSTEINKGTDDKYVTTLQGDLTTITVEVVDNVGNKETKVLSLTADKVAPTVISPKDLEFEVVDGVLYANRPIPYNLNAEDSESGVKGFTIDGIFRVNGSEAFVESSTSTLPVVKVFDNVGNEIEVPFWKLVGSKEFTSIVIDKTKPIGVFSKDGVVSGFYKDVNSVDLKISLTTKRGYVTVLDLEDNTLVPNRRVSDGDVVSVPVKNGENNVRVILRDVAWNVSEFSEILRVDNTAPSLEGTVNGSYNIKNDVIYAKDKLSISLTADDKESGVSKVVLLKDGVEIPVENSTVEISSNALSYKVRVEDRVGHIIEKNLDEFLSEQGITKWVFDSVAPVIKTNFAKPVAESSGEKLYNKDFLVNAVVEEDDETFESFELFDNGVSKGQLDKNTPHYTIKEEGKHSVKLVARDKSGNESVKDYSFTLDKTAPSNLNASVSTEVQNKDNGVFSKSPIAVTLGAKDNLVGVKGYWVNGVFQESNILSLTDGVYKIQVEDLAGNKTEEVALNTLTGWKSNNIYIDNVVPKISLKKHGGKWFNSEVSDEVVISDNLGIASYEVEINGIKVVNNTLEGFKTSVKELVKSSSVKSLESGRYDVKIKVMDLSGNVQEISDYYFIDNTKPVITNFEFITDGYLEGNTLNGANEYGFFFRDGAVVRVHVKDEGASSGLEKILVKVGESAERSVEIKNGYAEVTIPRNFKGWVSARAFDRVGNESSVAKPSGVVTEDANFSISNNYLDLVLPETPYRDANGNALYNLDISVGVVGRNRFAGLRSVKVNDTEEVYDIRGISNEVLGSKLVRDSNLVTDVNGVYSVSGNSNGITLNGVLVDRVGNSKSLSKVVSIDKDAPKVSISYSTSKENGVFNQTRVATISVEERNFSPEKVTISGKTGRISNWVNSGGTWTADMIFDSDGEYGFSVEVEDLAGNKSSVVQSENFVIDKTAPVIEVSFDNNNSSNGKYYSSGRVATVRVSDKNFSPSLITVEGGSVSGWTDSGDVHVASVVFNSDGVHNLKVSGSDLGGNVGNSFDSEEFVVDTTKPALSIKGVSNGVSYFKDFGFEVGYSDTNLDSARTSVTLVGREKGNIDIGSLDGLISYFNNSDKSDMDDLYTLKAFITDLAGNQVEETVVFSVNRGGSVFSFLNEDYNGKFLKEVGNIQIQETTVDELDEGTIQILLGDRVLSIPNDLIKVTKKGGADSKWVYSYEIDKSLFKEDGTYRIQLITKTKTGKENSSVAQEYVFVVDKTPPKVLVGGVEKNGSYRDSERRVSINIDDLSGVEGLRFLVNGKEVKVYWDNGIAYVDLKESSNTQNIEIRVTDKAGNEEVVVVDNVFINSSWLAQLVRTVWFKMGIVGLTAFIGWVFFLLFKRRKKREEEEKAISGMVSTASGTTGNSDTEDTVSLGGDNQDGKF